MNNSKKYLKYKTKYFELQKRLNNYQIGGVFEIGTKVKTKSNDGRLEEMRNQCFWISILHYLKENGYRDLTLTELRRQAGLDDSTKTMAFDQAYRPCKADGTPDIDGDLIFMIAAYRVAIRYNIQIQIYTVTDTGIIIGPAGHIGDVYAPNFVNIAQFGLSHFELIKSIDTKFGGAEGAESDLEYLKLLQSKSSMSASEDSGAFQPRVQIEDELTTTNDEKQLASAELKGVEIALKRQREILTFNQRMYDILLNNKSILYRIEIGSDLKGELLTNHGVFMDKFVIEKINAVEKKIQDLENQIKSLESLLYKK